MTEKDERENEKDIMKILKRIEENKLKEKEKKIIKRINLNRMKQSKLKRITKQKKINVKN